MKNKKKMAYIKKSSKLEIVRKFFETKKVGDQFDNNEIKEFLSKNYEWFRGLPKTTQDFRVWDLAKFIKEIYGEKIILKKPGGYKSPAIWELISEEVISPTVKTIEEKTESREKKPRRCGIERLKKFYLVIEKALNSKLGISKKDVEKIMGYETTFTTLGLKSLNNQIEGETGFRPFYIDKNHTFVNYDILQVNKEEAGMVLEELKEKLEGNIPEMPVFDDFESEVKSIIRKDYFTLSMFAKSNTIFHKDGDMERFRKAVVAKSVVISIDEVANKFRDTLFKRYNITDLKFICRSKKYVTIADSEDSFKIKQALIKIENIFAEYFCEDIVDPERTVWSKEIEKDNTPTNEEQAQLKLIEHAIFDGQDGEIFLSDLWNRFDLLNVKRGWPVLDLLKKFPEKFKVDSKPNLEGITEILITYSAPTKEEVEEVKEEVPEKVEEEADEQQETPIFETKKEEVSVGGEVVEVKVGFSNREDLRRICGNELDYQEVCKYHDDYVFEINVDKNNKKSILNYLKLYLHQ